VLKIKSIKLGNFRLFRSASLNFEGKSGLINLIGINHDLFQSNSSGKTTLPLAIEYGLFSKNHLGINLSDLKGKDVVSPMEVQVEFEYGGVSYEVFSGVTSYLKREGKDWINGKSAVKAEMEKILNIPFEVFVQLFYLSDKSKLFFTEADAKAQSTLLKTLLSLDFLDTIHTNSKKDIDLSTREYNLIQKQYEAYQKNIDLLDEQINQVDVGSILQLNEDITGLTLQFEKTKKELDLVESELDNCKLENGELKSKLSNYEGQMSQLQNQLSKYAQNKNKAVCQLCGQEIPKGVSLYDMTKSEMATLQKLIDEVSEQFKESRGIHAVLKERASTLKTNKIQMEVELSRLTRLREDDSVAQAQLELSEKFIEQKKEILRGMAKLQISMDGLEAKVYVAELIKQCSGNKGFIKDRIDRFSKLFNIHLRELSKELLGDALYIKTEDNVLKVTDGEKDFKFIELSSGLSARVKIVGLIALLESIKTLSGFECNLLFLDEILSTIDDVQPLQDMLLKIQAKYPDKLIFLVSHEKQIAGQYSLIVERKLNKSTLRWE